MDDRCTGPWRLDESRSAQGTVDNTRPRLRTKGRLSSYLGTHRSALSLERLDPQPFERFVPRLADHVYNPEPEHMITTMMMRLLGNPAEGLPPEHNSFLLHVFEAYRKLQRDRDILQCRLEQEAHGHQVHILKFHHAEALWSKERQAYKAELKQLESLCGLKNSGAPIASTNLTEWEPAASKILLPNAPIKNWEAVGRIEDQTCKRVEGTYAAIPPVIDTRLMGKAHHRSRQPSSPESVPNREGTSTRIHRQLQALPRTSNVNRHRQPPECPKTSSLHSAPQSRTTSIYSAERLDKNSFSAAGDLIPTYESGKGQALTDLLNGDNDFDVNFQLSTWLANTSGTNSRRSPLGESIDQL